MSHSELVQVEGEYEISVTDDKGNDVLLWNENSIGRLVRKWFQQRFAKTGKFEYFAKYGVRIPFLLGNFSKTLFSHNVFTNAGKAALAGLMGDVGSVSIFDYVAVGTSTTAAAATQTALIAEIVDSGLARAATTNTRVTTTTTDDSLNMAVTFTVTGTKAVTEIGAFNAASGGTMAGRSTFAAINVSNGFNLQVNYKFVIS